MCCRVNHKRYHEHCLNRNVRCYSIHVKESDLKNILFDFVEIFRRGEIHPGGESERKGWEAWV